MRKMIDIFGDGECVFDKENLPDEFIAVSGKWRKANHGSGKPSYSMVEPSQWYIDNVIEPGKAKSIEQNDKIEKENRITQKMREMAIEALEKEKNE